MTVAAGLTCVGLSHHSCPVAERERFYIQPKDIPEVLGRLKSAESISEVALLSTCNRIELYGVAEPDQLEQSFRSLSTPPPPDDALVIWRGRDAARHLFAVSSSLDSQVVGEPQILGQVRDAYAAAQDAGTLGVTLHTLFQSALKVGKRVRTQTRIGQSPVSLSSIAVLLCEQIFGELAGRHAAIIGAGEMSQLAAEHFHDRGARLSILSTRSEDTARRMAHQLGCTSFRLDDLDDKLRDADIVFCGSGAPHTILDAEKLRAVQAARHHRPLFVVDLGMPRNVDPDAGQLENVFLYNMDSLKQISEEHQRARAGEISLCEQILEEETAQFLRDLTDAGSVDVLARLRSQIRDVVVSELRRSGVDDPAVEALSKSIPNRVMQEAFRRARQASTDDHRTFLAAVKHFFGL